MSQQLNQHVSNVTTNLTTEQREVLSCVQEGIPTNANAQTLGAMVRNGLIAFGETGALSLSTLGARVVNL